MRSMTCGETITMTGRMLVDRVSESWLRQPRSFPFAAPPVKRARPTVYGMKPPPGTWNDDEEDEDDDDDEALAKYDLWGDDDNDKKDAGGSGKRGAGAIMKFIRPNGAIPHTGRTLKIFLMFDL